MSATATRARCAVCDQAVDTYAKPRAGETRPRPKSHTHPDQRTAGGWPAMCPGVFQQVAP